MPRKQPDRKSPRLKDFDYSTLATYFITINCFNREEYFTNDDLNRKIIECLRHERERTNFSVYTYCLMPDHLHLLVSPSGDGLSVSEFVGGFKSKTTRIGWKYGIKGKLWQGRFHDHIVRKKEGPVRIAEYILNNPVNAKLVNNWEKYPYSGIIDKYY
ncbi:MAG: transposase [bacterium]